MRGCFVLLIALLLVTASAAQEGDREQKAGCILCKITELVALVAVPLLILALIGATPIALLIFIVFGLRWRDPKEDPKRREGAKKIVIATAVLYGLMAAALIFICVLVFTGLVGGGCGMCGGIPKT